MAVNGIVFGICGYQWGCFWNLWISMGLFLGSAGVNGVVFGICGSERGCF